MFSRSRNPLLTFLLSFHVWLTSKIQVNLRYRRYSKVLMILSYKFLTFLQYLCFWGQEIHFWHSYKDTMFGWPPRSKSASGTGGTRRYWCFCLINFRNFFSIHVFEVKKSIADSPTELPCLGDLENPSQLPVQDEFEGTELVHLRYKYFDYFFSITNVSEVKKSISEIPTELPCSGDLENPGQLPVQEVLEGTDVSDLINFRNFFSIHVFEVKKSIADIPTELPCLGDLENLGQLPVQNFMLFV